MKKFAVYGLVLLAMFGCSAVFAEDNGRGIELEEIENPKPSFYVRVDVNHEDLTYTEGDLLKVNVISSVDGYLYLFYKNAQGDVSLLYPNQFHPDNRIQKRKAVAVPEEGSNFQMRVTSPFGEEQLLAVVCKNQVEEFETKDLGSFFTPVTKSDWESFKKGITVAPPERPDVPEMSEISALYLLGVKTVEKSASYDSNRGNNSFFVGIGVGDYKDPMINRKRLPTCPVDVERMTDLFVEKCGVPKDNILTLINEDATLEQIQKLFCEALPEVTKPGDVIFVYWSGHGGSCGDKDGDEKDGRDEYLVPYDAVLSEPRTMLVDDDFGVWVQKLDRRKIFFIIDACYSAGNATNLKSLDDEGDRKIISGFFDKTGDKAASAPAKVIPFDFGFEAMAQMKDIGQRDLALIASSAADEVSLVRTENDMSVMTYFIIEELSSKSGISHVQLFDAIKPKVEKYVKENYGFYQTPQMQDEFEAPLILNP